MTTQGPWVTHRSLEDQLRELGISVDAPPSTTQWRSLLELNHRLARERDHLQMTVDSMGDGLCVLDAKGLVEMANPAAEQILCAEPGALLGKDLGEVVGGGWPIAGERRVGLRELRVAMRSCRSCRFDDARFMTLTREWLPVSFVLRPIDLRSPGSVLIFRDIRARKAAENALRESESRFRAIFESAAVGMVRVGLDGRIAECNGAFAEMLGDTRPDVIGEIWFERMHPDDRAAAREWFERLQDAAPNGEHEVEHRYVSREGTVVWTMHTISFVRGSGGEAVFAIGVVKNVTARKNLEASLRQSQKLEAVGQLAAGIAHEINTPIQFVGDSLHFLRDGVSDLFGLLERYRALRDRSSASIPGIADDLAADLRTAEEAADLDFLSQQMPKALDRALDGLGRVTAIVRGMKEFAHPNQIEKVPTDLNHALQTTLTVAKNEYKYIAEVETDFGELPPVVCHVGELNQVFLNVIVNAAHAIADVVGDTGAKGRIDIKTWRAGDFVHVAIADTGGGIAAPIRDKIFDPFFTTKEVGRGTGQGLAIARSVVVDKHQGELTFQTKMGVGTTFIIRLPIEPPRRAT